MLRAFICRAFQNETIVIYVAERGNVELSQPLWSRKLDTVWQRACLWSPACRAAGRLSGAAAEGLAMQGSPLRAENLLSHPGSQIDGF